MKNKSKVIADANILRRNLWLLCLGKNDYEATTASWIQDILEFGRLKMSSLSISPVSDVNKA